ncbi:FGGY family carbohydrate kinase [Pedobacter sp. MC2016-15]|uniref:xylulokinase n=1 Tax=Pedobacter sp. MC2016-15 TaxID=2994473 RepID=UPI002245F98F|nr:FGGY family carbohydrate kinase [Pedobacter sp. MC2016-15]MCX2480941.1 FGGY family carbohydrate kinase [Pedobacter sp. MC2016-15]
MLLLGIDIGTSSIKVAVVDSATQQVVTSAQFPDEESLITAIHPGWAEQSPEMWWEHVQQAFAICKASGKFNPRDISSIGIAYQMHGLVLVDKHQNLLRDSIIWCDSRAVDLGNAAFDALGHEFSLSHLLNSPGNFTASKLAWVKQNEPELYDTIDKIMLPGDFIAMKLTSQITTSISALSEGIFWDFQTNSLSAELMEYYGFSPSLIPEIKPVFAEHGRVSSAIAAQLGLKEGTPVTYKAGDQPNNALSLNVLEPGEVAATAGTSGVIYGVSDQLTYDDQSRVNTFAHVNYAEEQKRLGVLLCINGTGSLNRWTKNLFGAALSYGSMNAEAKKVKIGADGLRVLPFGNGAERMLNNRLVGVHFQNIDLNLHSQAHLFRGVQEGIAFSFRYGFDIMRANGMSPSVIRAGKANLFLSDLFLEAFVNSTGVPVELYENDGSVGAALGSGIGAKTFSTASEAFHNIKCLQVVEPTVTDAYESVYQEWLHLLNKQLNNKI